MSTKNYRKYIVIDPEMFKRIKLACQNSTFMMKKDLLLKKILKNERMSSVERLENINKVLSSSIFKKKPPESSEKSTQTKSTQTKSSEERATEIDAEDIFHDASATEVEPVDPPIPTQEEIFETVSRPARPIKKPTRKTRSDATAPRQAMLAALSSFYLPPHPSENLFDMEQAQKEFIENYESTSGGSKFDYRDLKVQGMGDYEKDYVVVENEKTGENLIVEKPKVVIDFQKKELESKKLKANAKKQPIKKLDPKALASGAIWRNYESYN